MDFWGVLVILVGSIGALGLASFFVPGLANFVSQAFSSLFAAIRQVVQWMVDMLPRPLKILLFIGLFASVGIMAYNFTYGAQFICQTNTNNVVQVGWLEGMTFKLTSSESDNVFQENQQTNTLLGLNTTTPLDVNTVLAPNGSNVIKQQNGVWKGDNYSIFFALMPRIEPVSFLGITSFMETNDGDIWDKWLQGEDHIEYQLCEDVITQTCELRRYHLPNNYYSLPSGGCGASSIIVTQDPWAGRLGTLYYYGDTNAKTLTASYSEGGSYLGNFFAGLIGGSTSGVTDRCKTITTSKLNDLIQTVDGSSLYSGAASTYASELIDSETRQVKEATMVTLVVHNLFGGDGKKYTIPIYNVDWAGVMHESTSDTTFTDAVLTLGKDGQITDTRKCTGADGSTCDRTGLLADSKPVDEGQYDLVKVSCDADTKDPNDTKITIAGLNIMDPMVMTFIIVIGGLIAFIARIIKF